MKIIAAMILCVLQLSEVFAQDCDSHVRSVSLSRQNAIGDSFDTSEWLVAYKPPAGEECEYSIFVHPEDGQIGDYLFVESDIELTGPNNFFGYGFGIEITDLLNSFEIGNRMTFFQVRSIINGVEVKLLNVKLKKVFTFNPGDSNSPDFDWLVQMIWFNPNDNTKTTLEKRLPGIVTDMSIRYERQETGGSYQGSIESFVEIDGVGVDEERFDSPYFDIEAYPPTIFKRGLINSNINLKLNDGMRIFPPYDPFL